MEISSIEVNWMLGWANSPSLKVHVDKAIPHSEFVYNKFPPTAKEKFWLLSNTEQHPWYRFVWVDKPDGNPTYHGALGGEYKLTNGEVCKTRTGWSSRPGVVNREFKDFLSYELVDVSLYEAGKITGWAGYYLAVDVALRGYIANHCDWYLVREVRDNGEIVWTPSVDPKIPGVKPGL